MFTPPCVSFQAMKNGRRKADPFSCRSDIRKRKQKQFSRPMTGHTPQKLPSFDAISCIIAVRAEFPFTRSIMIPYPLLFVKHKFRKNHKVSCTFSVITDKSFPYAFDWINIFVKKGQRQVLKDHAAAQGNL